MSFLKNRMKKSDLALNIGKISIILLVAVFLIGNIIPYYEAKDAHLYGIAAVNLSNGIYSDTNELLEETGRSEFVGSNWIQTIHDTAIPMSGAGLFVIGAFFYILGGYTGLLLVSPIFAILLLVFSERIATNLFGKYVGLLALLFLATSNLLFRNSISLQTESVFSVFLILGAFFLIKALKYRKSHQFFLASLFFVFSAFIRINGIIFLPAEIFVIVGYFIFTTIRQERLVNYKNQIATSKSKIYITKLFSKSKLKTGILILIPWIIFFIFYFSYNAYFFGDALTNYGSVESSNIGKIYETKPDSLLKFEKQDFENLKEYSKYLLPYQMPAIFNRSADNFENILGNEWLGGITLLILLSILLFSLFKKKKRIELLTFSALILANLWFFSAITTEHRASFGVAGRYMLPGFILSSIIYGFIIMEFFNFRGLTKKKSVIFSIKFLKVIVVILLVGFFFFAFYFWPTMDGIVNSEINFNNIEKFASRYPLDLEGLENNDVGMAANTDRIREYGVIPFILYPPNVISNDSVILLKKILQDDYDVYVLKEPTTKYEKDSLRVLTNEHGFIIKDHSKSFCKILIGEEGKFQKSDDICLKN